MRKYRNPFPNTLRSNDERKARYCFLRCCGLSRDESRIVVSYRDSRIVMYLHNREVLLNGFQKVTV